MTKNKILQLFSPWKKMRNSGNKMAHKMRKSGSKSYASQKVFFNDFIVIFRINVHLNKSG